MTTTIEGVKQNPEATREDLRRMSLTINELIKNTNNGAFQRITLSSTGSVTLDDRASIWLFDATDGALTATLPDVTTVKDRVYAWKKTDSITNAVLITPSSTAALIDGSTNKVISAQNVAFEGVSNGLNWFLI